MPSPTKTSPTNPSPTRPLRALDALLHTAACVALPCLLVLVLDGCASPSPPPPGPPPDGGPTAQTGDPAPTRDAAAPADPDAGPDPAAGSELGADLGAARIQCFFGTTRQRMPDGTDAPAADLLLRRQLEPAASRIVEDSVRYDATTGKVHHYRVVMEVDADAATFTLREVQDLYAGSGRLEGEPWDWTAWTLSYRLDSGITVEGRSEVRRGEDGGLVLHGEKQASGPDGALALTLVETLPELTFDACEERFTKVVEAQAPASP